MINLFGQASDRLCQKLDAAATDGEDVEMESLFSRLTLDVIGKAVFNYDFDSLTNDAGIVEVFTFPFLCFHFWVFRVCYSFDTIIITYFYAYMLTRTGGLYCSERSRRSQHCTYSILGDPNMERHITQTKEGFCSPQINQ